MTNTMDQVVTFFARYEAALLARDEHAIAGLYAVPALILFPNNVILVRDTSETEAFFASSWDQYAGVKEVDRQIVLMGEAPGSVWVDVTWSYRGAERERFCYQLIDGLAGYQIAVLTPLALAAG